MLPRTIPFVVLALLIALAVVLQGRVAEEVRPEPPVWSRPLEGPWDGSPDSPSLVDGCRDLLRKSREGDWGALGRLDRRLHAIARERGTHPLAHVDAWRDLLRSLPDYDAIPGPGIHRFTWESDLPGRDEVRCALLVAGEIRERPASLVLSLPAPGEDAAEHLERHWQGGSAGLLVLAPVRSEASPRHLGEMLQALRHARARWPIDDDRVLIAGRGAEIETASRIAASFTDRFAGVVADVPRPGVAPLRENLETLPWLRLRGNAPPVEQVRRWLDRGPSGRPVRRDLYPGRIDWAIGPDRTEDRAWWLIVSRLEPGVGEARLRAEVLPGNRIEIQAEGVVGFRVLLNDRIVDLDRTVVLRVNGDHIVSRIPTRSVRRVVDAVEALGDLSAVFPEVVDVDLTRR